MATLTWTLAHSADNGTTWTTITDWQSASLRRGKQSMYDPLQAGGGTITGRNPGNQPAFAIGDPIRLVAEVDPALDARPLTFFVSDYQIDYGITASQDVWTLVVEDYFGWLGRRPKTISWSAGKTVGEAIVDLASINPYIIGSKSGFSTVPLSAQSFTDTPRLEILNTLANTGAVVLSTWRDSVDYTPYGLNARERPTQFNQNPLTETPPVFTDSQASPPVDIAFDQLRFGSLTDNYYDKVTVIPDGLAAQTAGTGEKELIVDTYNQNTADALNLAQYLLAIQSSAATGPQQISALFEAQPSTTSAQALLLLSVVPYLDLRSCVVEFRGAEYPVIVIGEQWSINPAQTRVTYNLFNGSNYNFLVLDDATFGKLDENKLGW